MRIISRKLLREFWEKHSEAQSSLEAWYHDVKKSHWKSPNDIKRIYRNADFVSNNRIIFNIKGNQYRLIVAVQYQMGIVYIRFIGSHQDYDKVDASVI